MRYDSSLGKHNGKSHHGGARSTLCVSSQVFLVHQRFEIFFLFGFVCEIVIVFVLNGFVVIWDRLVVKWGVLSVPLGLWGLRAI